MAAGGGAARGGAGGAAAAAAEGGLVLAATAPLAWRLTWPAGTSGAAASASATTERTCSERGAAGRVWRGCSAAKLLLHCPRAVPRNDMATRALLGGVWGSAQASIDGGWTGLLPARRCCSLHNRRMRLRMRALCARGCHLTGQSHLPKERPRWQSLGPAIAASVGHLERSCIAPRKPTLAPPGQRQHPALLPSPRAQSAQHSNRPPGSQEAGSEQLAAAWRPPPP